jgi:hypothetical protein
MRDEKEESLSQEETWNRKHQFAGGQWGRFQARLRGLTLISCDREKNWKLIRWHAKPTK